MAGADSYELYRWHNGAWIRIGGVLTTTTYNDGGLAPATTYWYIVRAVTDGAPSPWSNQDPVTTPSSDATSYTNIYTNSYIHTLCAGATSAPNSYTFDYAYTHAGALESDPDRDAGWPDCGHRHVERRGRRRQLRTLPLARRRLDTGRRRADHNHLYRRRPCPRDNILVHRSLP